MQSKSKPFDDLSNLMTNAMGAVKGVSDEVKAIGRARADSLIADMDLVGREEFEVFKALVTKQSAQIDALKAELAALKKPLMKTTKTRAAKPKATAKAKAAPNKAAPKKTATKKAATNKTSAKKTASAKKA